MEKPGNWFAIIKMWKKHPKEKEIKKIICVFTQKFTLGQCSVPAWGNQPPGFSIRGTSTLNGLFQTIKILMSYTKRLHQLKHGVLFHLKLKSLELFNYYLLLVISDSSSIWKFRNLPLHKRRTYLTLTSFSILPFFSLPMPKSVHVWPQLDNEVSTWFS